MSDDANQTTTDQLTQQNPVTRYPRISPPAKALEGTGLDSEMNPKADLGEHSYRGTGRLEGRKALITGGDSGIGGATAIAFAREGADVAISYLEQEQSDAEHIASAIKETGRKAVLLPGDLRDKAFAKKLVDDAIKELGGLDIIVNNGGKQVSVNELTDIDDEQIEATFDVNIMAMLRVVRAALLIWPPAPRSSTRRRSRPTTPRRTCWTMRPQRRRSTTSPRASRKTWRPRESG